MRSHLKGIIALMGLILSFVVIRFPLLSVHGMKQWTTFLFIVGTISITFSELILKKSIIAVFTTIGYMIGFILGIVFVSYSKDPGGGMTNNTWIIWAITMGICIIVGIVLSFISKKSV